MGAGMVEILIAQVPRDQLVAFLTRVIRAESEAIMSLPGWPGDPAAYMAGRVVDALAEVAKVKRERDTAKGGG